MSLIEEAAAVEADETKTQRALRVAKAELARTQSAVDTLERKVDLLTAIDGTRGDGPTWTLKRKRKSGNAGIANLFLSDLHLDEVVDPDEMGGVNKYDRSIAEMRLKRCAEGFAFLAKDFLAGVDYQGAAVWLGGDIFSGNIHEELKQTNEASIIASVDHWIDPLVDVLRFAADEFGKVHVPCVVGNHGRNTYKPVMKGRVEDNFDWLLYRQLARALKHDSRVTFQIPKSADCHVQQFGTKFCLTHGDQFRGGSGISGYLTPLTLGNFRKLKRYTATNQAYDYLLLGHFHQYGTFLNIIANGSLKGYDEYAATSNFGFEVPQQAFWVTTPERGVTFSAPVQPMNREAEGW